MSAPALQTVDLYKRFGGLTVTNAVHLVLEHGARHALIGPNGAGRARSSICSPACSRRARDRFS